MKLELLEKEHMVQRIARQEEKDTVNNKRQIKK